MYIWLGASKDTYVTSNTPSQNLGDGIWINVSGVTDPFDENAYVHFSLPQLPTGASITEAYLNIHRCCAGGTPIRLVVHTVASPWSPLSLTWPTQPTLGGVTTFTYPISVGTDEEWYGTGDIGDVVRRWRDEPQLNHGLMIDWDRLQGNGSLTFYSNNELDRTKENLGRSPRLLLELSLLENVPTSDIMPPLAPPDTDLGSLGSSVRILRIFEGGNNFPATWKVAKGRPPGT